MTDLWLTTVVYAIGEYKREYTCAGPNAFKSTLQSDSGNLSVSNHFHSGWPFVGVRRGL